MKKLFYVFILAASLALSFASCTQEVIKPKTDNPGGSPIVVKGA